MNMPTVKVKLSGFLLVCRICESGDGPLRLRNRVSPGAYKKVSILVDKSASIMKYLLLALIRCSALLSLAAFLNPLASAAGGAVHPDLDAYFEAEVRGIEKRTHHVMHPESAAKWADQKPELKRQLAEMLGLDPIPSRTPLEPVVTGRIEREDYVVENLHFQSMPGLYVTGNLYLPKQIDEAVPAILYVCGHAPVKENGVSYGNKTAYQHHGIWFARHGFVCLTIDTIQLGEIEGIHHGTYRENRWWWNSRGYTSAGVETWNGIRALDYLQSRPEVDGERLGMTGRSGGGVYSWWVGALDDRVKAIVPVAGITDLRNYVIDGAVEGHCDCMFMVNRYRWDYPLIASLIAPRALLIANSDKDSIFPLDGVVRTHRQVRDVYGLLGAEDRLGLLITEGPHRDTQDLQVPSFRWFQRWLKESDELIGRAAIKEIAPIELKVFEKIPPDEIITTVDEVFVPMAKARELPKSISEWDRFIEQLRAALRFEVFMGWPQEEPTGEFVPGFTFWKTSGNPSGRLLFQVDDAGKGFYQASGHQRNQIRRRYMLIGQTLDSMRVFEMKRFMEQLSGNDDITLAADGDMAVNLLYAALMMDVPRSLNHGFRLQLSGLSETLKEAPDFLNIMKVTRLDECLAAVSRRFDVVVEDCPGAVTEYASRLNVRLGSNACRLTIK